MKKNKRKTGALVSLMLICFLTLSTFTGCESYENFKDAFIDKEGLVEETVRIGVYEPLSGADKEYGELEKMGIELGNELFPTALGKKVELLYFDNKSDIYIAETVVKEMVDKRVALVLGSYGSVNSLMAVSLLEAASIPAITITNTNPLVTSYNPFYFRVTYTDAFQGVALAKYVVEGMALKNAAVMKPLNNDFAAAVSKSFSNKMIQLSEDTGSILISEDYVSGKKDYAEQLRKISESGAKAVFLPADVKDAVRIISQASEMKLNLTFLGTDEWASEKLTDLKMEDPNIKIVYATLVKSEDGDNPLSEAFLRAFHSKYGEDQEPSDATALAFDAYLIGIDSINRAGTALDGNAIRLALKETMQYKGVSGTISFDEQGDPIKSVAIKGIAKGTTERIFTVEPTWVVLEI